MKHDWNHRGSTSPFIRSVSHHSDEWDSEGDQRRGSRKQSFLRKKDSKDNTPGEETEDYWFVCRRWFAKGEDDGKIVRELLPTDEHGHPIDTGLEEVTYKVTVYTGDVSGAGTDANIYMTMTGEYGDTGERQLSESNNMNKFERNQEDVFTITAVHLGQLKKVKIRHDNKGIGAAWFLGHIEVEDTKTKETYFLPCQRWLAVKEDDGQIARELVPVDKALKQKLSRKDSMAIRNEIALETAAAMTTYHVRVYTGDKFGAGTDADVYVQLFGGEDDTGTINLKSSKTHKNKFERNQMDEFVVQAVDIGELQKIKIGHNNANGGGAWFLDKVEIDCPSLGKKWYFPCGRWLAKDEDDGRLERELFPSEGFTEDYTPFSPYEITVYTSDISSAGTDADVFIVLFGKETSTTQKSLCANKQERKQYFERKCADKFVIELEDIGDTIEKIRVGHDGAGFGAGWHLDKIEVRRLKESGKGSETYIFKCNRWLAKNEDDGAIVRELVADKVRDETVRKDGTVKVREKERKETLIAKTYDVSVFTGDVKGGGTDANVFLTIFGYKGDTGERKLAKSETHRDKFEKGQEDKFGIEAVDLGNLYKVRIRHDNALLSPAWFLDRVEVKDSMTGDKYTFHCERWLGKNKTDGKIDRVLYVKGYEGDMSSTSTMQSHMMAGSIASIDSLRSGDPFSRSPRISRSQLEEIPEGPTIPYTVKVATGDEKEMGTESSVWIRIIGTKQKQTGKLPLDLAQRKKFEPSSIETFSVEAVDVKDIRKIELGIDSLSAGEGWFVKEVQVDMPTKGKHVYFTCKAWLARDKADGKTSRVFTLNDGDTATTVSYKPMVSYEVTIHTGDITNAGTDSQIFMKVFGANGCTSDIVLDKQSERFERGRADLIKLQIEDIVPLKKLRIGHDGKGDRKDWYLEKVEMRNMDTGDLTVFKADCWFSAIKEDKKICRDIVAVVKGKAQVHVTTYKVYVKTSDLTGASTSANVFLIIFGENGDSDKLPLKDLQNKSPFKNNQQDVFTFSDMLSLGQLVKARVWHDNKGFGSAWHLAHIEVEDCKTGQRYMFPCNRWLSTSDDDNQVCRELSCANLSSPGTKEKIEYEIEVTTTDKKEAGMTHNAWLILEGDQKNSKVFFMENSAKNKILRRGQTDTFTMVTRNLGQLERCNLGAVQRDDKPLDGGSGHETQWHCHQVVVTNKRSGDRYTFSCKAWIDIHHDVKQKYAKVLKVHDVQESKLTAVRNLGNVKYEVVVVTGDVRGAGTDANVYVILYGTHGDTGKRRLQQKGRDLFERNRTDKFVIEAIDLGDLVKLQIEHDNSGFGAAWMLDHVEVTNMATNQHWVFPCGQWFDKKCGDGQICREILPRD